MVYHYASKDFDKTRMARAVGISIPVSVKHSVEVCNFIREKNLEDAKKALQDVMDKKRAVPYRRYNRDLGHKPGIGIGRYPIKTSGEIKRLLESAEANAQFKGLNTSSMIVSHISVRKAPRAMHYGRKRGRKMKRAHIEIVLEETRKAKDAPKKKEGKASAHKESEPIHQHAQHAAHTAQEHAHTHGHPDYAKGEHTHKKEEGK